MLKSYITTLQKDVLTVVCEPEKGHELAVTSLSVFGGANGGYITISIGDFSMQHSIAANGRIVFPFFMGVQENMAINAIATNDDIRVCVSAEQFVVDSNTGGGGDVPEIDYASMPLTITALEDGVTVKIESDELVIKSMDLAYKLNSNDWETWSFNESYVTNSIILNTNDCLQIKNKQTSWNRLYTTLNVEGKFNVSGNVRSLINFSTTLAEYQFANLFTDKESLISAENLILFDVELSNNCFMSMFIRCINLEKPPKITNLPTAVNVGEHCLDSFLSNCSSLKEIRVSFTQWGYNQTRSWVNDVAPTGTFYKPKDLPEEYGVNRIPEGWTVVNID